MRSARPFNSLSKVVAPFSKNDGTDLAARAHMMSAAAMRGGVPERPGLCPRPLSGVDRDRIDLLAKMAIEDPSGNPIALSIDHARALYEEII